MSDLRIFQTFYRTRTVGAEQYGVTIVIRELLENARDPWTGKTGPAVRFKMDDEKYGVSYHTLPQDIFLASWTI